MSADGLAWLDTGSLIFNKKIKSETWKIKSNLSQELFYTCKGRGFQFHKNEIIQLYLW
jgi:hypothetical protein